MFKKLKTVVGISSIAIVVLALTFMIVDWAVPLNLFTHPVLNFLAIIFIGFGIMTLVLAFMKKSQWFIFLSAILTGLFALYLLLNLLGLNAWWIAVVIMVAIWIIYAILSITVFGYKTENIAKNKSPEYKNYEQRKAEKAAAEAEKEEEPLPEIKSFKD